MPLHLPQRLHAAVHGLFRSKDETEAQALWQDVSARFVAHGLGTEADRTVLIETITDTVLERLRIATNHPQRAVVQHFIDQLFRYETMFVLPDINWDEKRSTAKWWEVRDALLAQKALVANFDQTVGIVNDTVTDILHPLYAAAPALTTPPDTDGIHLATDLIHSLGDAADVTHDIFFAPHRDEIIDAELFPRLRANLRRNIVLASGRNPDNPESLDLPPRLPKDYKASTPAERIEAYLGGTPLLDLFRQSVPFVLRTKARFEHHHIVAGSGHGKTQTLQYLIGQDLAAVAAGQRSVVVLDSQGDLIRNIASLAEFAPGGPLHDRVVIIDPTDIEYPVSLNLFDVGLERMQGYAPLERERLQNSILELYDFVLGTLLDAQMTQKQNVIFRYVTRLMLHIPNATIHTLRELMEPGSEVKFAGDIAKLEGTAKHFFATEFSSREFEQTKKQVLRRLWGILENQTFERMFSHPRSKLDLFAEMNAGKVILINTAKDLLKESGTEIFGRFFIAMIAQAAQERAVLGHHERTPTMVYIDEAQDYFDRNIGLILAQARKYNVGMVLAHQYLGQLDPKLQEAFAANTAIKFAGGVSSRDAKTLAPMLHADAGLIESQPKGSFAAFVRGDTPNAVPLQFPFGWLEGKPKLDHAERDHLRAIMRERYAVHYSTLSGVGSGAAPAPEPMEPDVPEPEPPKDDDGFDTDASTKL